MKPELLLAASSSPLGSRHSEPFDVLPPVIKKRDRERTPKGNSDRDDDSSHKEVKLPRLPSIKHLQLDLLFPSQCFNDHLALKRVLDHSVPQHRAQPQAFPKQQQAASQHQMVYQHSIQIQKASKPLRPIAPANIAPQPPTTQVSPMNVQSTTPPPSSTQEMLVPVVTNNFGFIETTFANVPVKKTHRRRPANIDKSTLYCHNCGAKNTPEWRRGPLGPATLCNACGLAYAKRLRQEEDTQSQVQMQMSTMGVPLVVGQVQCQCTQSQVYGRCGHVQQGTMSSPMVRSPQGSQGQSVGMQAPIRINSHTFHQYNPPTQNNAASFTTNPVVFY